MGGFLCQNVLCVPRILWELSPRLLCWCCRGSCTSVVVFSHRFHGFPQMVRLRYWRRGYGRMPYPPNLCVSVPICGRHFSARMFCVFRVFCGTLSPFALLVLQRKLRQRGSILPRISRISRWLGCVIGGVGMAGMPYPPNLCASVSICGRLSLPECSVCSACSVGTLSLFALLVLQRQLHQRGSILPRNSRNPRNVRLRYWRRGYGRMPYPPNLCASVPICGRLSLPEGSVCSAYSVGHTLPVCLVGALETSAPPKSAP